MITTNRCVTCSTAEVDHPGGVCTPCRDKRLEALRTPGRENTRSRGVIGGHVEARRPHNPYWKSKR